jgi:peptidoglycan/xylan/chitin deacetylase (PgdA/CDA1 family)
LEEPKFVISLDFELHWGVFDKFGDRYNDNVLGARTAVPEILALFRTHDVYATWATVGLLFNESDEDYESYKPAHTPSYVDETLNAFDIEIGKNEDEDKLHFAHSLIQQILDSPGQELASHSYSHYYCLAAGQTAQEFQLDIQSAVAIAKDKFDVDLRSFVFPKNQVNSEYLDVLRQNSFSIFRGEAPSTFKWVLGERCFRLLDSYFKLSKGTVNSVQEVNGIKVINADRFLRPYRFQFLNHFMVKRIIDEMTFAAKHGSVYHLWWHPHNFGKNLKENLSNLEQILSVFSDLREKYGMRSVCMRDL